MMRITSVHIARVVSCLLLFFAGTSTGQSHRPAQSAPSTPVLPLIEKYKAPPYPKSQFLTAETYEYRISYKRPVPPTLTDVFICDIWQRVTLDMKLTITPQEISEDIANQAIRIYLTKNWSDIAGYRPWTHWNFIRTLKVGQRTALAKEVVAYIGENGVRDVEEDAQEKK